MIRVLVAGLSLTKMGFMLLLRSTVDARALRIFIGGAEAQSIALHLSKTAVPRPLTHDLMRSLLAALHCTLVRVEVHNLVENTFYGRLVLEHNGAPFEMDSRPSDAVALALRCGVPIFVAETVMNQAGVVVEDKKHAPSPVEIARQQMDQAIREERYEDAAKLRDEIRRLTKPEPSN